VNIRDFSIYIRDDDTWPCSIPGCTEPDSDYSIELPHRRSTFGDLIDAVQAHIDTFHKAKEDQ
jgi:hypothetical protein